MIRITIVSGREQHAAAESLRSPGDPAATEAIAVAVETTYDEYDLLADDGTAPVGVLRVRERRNQQTMELSLPALRANRSYEQYDNARNGLLRLALHRARRSGLQRVIGPGLPAELADDAAPVLRNVEDLYGTFDDAPVYGVLDERHEFALTNQAVDEYVLLGHGEAYEYTTGSGEVIRGEIEEVTPHEGFEPYRKRAIYGPGDHLPPGRYLSRGQCELARTHDAEAYGDTETRPAVPSIGLAAMNSYVLAHVACSLEEIGFFEYVRRHPSNRYSFTATYEALKVRRELFRAMLRYLEIAGLVRFDAQVVDWYSCDAPAVARLRREMGYLLFMVRGYAPVLGEMTALVRGEKRYYHDIRRNDEGVQKFFQSYEIDVQPELNRVLDGLTYRHVAHIGCGTATRLIAMCRKNDRIRATGIEIDAAACAAARLNVEHAGLADRITIIQRDVYDYVREPHTDVDLVLLVAGMFHDFHNRPQGATPLLQSLRNCIDPEGHLVVEDQNLCGSTEPDCPLSVADGFEFVHTLVGAKLFTREQYTDLFLSSGWSVEMVRGNQLACDWIYVLRAS